MRGLATGGCRPLFACLAIVVLLPAAAGAGEDDSGYGPLPRHPEQIIREVADANRVEILLPPRPHALRDPETGEWLYGWRLCAHIEPGDRAGFFLLQGDRIIAQRIETIGPDGSGARTVADLCGLRLPLRRSAGSGRSKPQAQRDPLLGGG